MASAPETTPTQTNLPLLPCPFCGGTPAMVDYHGTHMTPEPDWVVHCRECDLSLDGKPTPEEAAALWNKRAPTNG